MGTLRGCLVCPFSIFIFSKNKKNAFENVLVLNFENIFSENILKKRLKTENKDFSFSMFSIKGKRGDMSCNYYQLR